MSDFLLTDEQSPFVLWQLKLREHENECPWPGPRPLSLARDRSNFWRFVGRKAEIRTFLRNLDEHILVVLHGNSGAGKTTLVEMGLITVMRQRGYVPILLREWENVGSDPDLFLKRALGSESEPVDDPTGRLPRVVQDAVSASDDPVAVLDAAFNGKAVLIFDQFEELIRYQPEEFRIFRSWLSQTLRTRRTKIVLSLRSEYVYELAELLMEVRPFDAVHQPLVPISSEDEILGIIRGPNATGARAITEEAVAQVLSWWLDLEPDGGLRSLLYLHALMFSLFWRAAGRTIDASVIQGLIGETDGSSPAIFARGFDEAIEHKLRMCQASYEDLALPRRTILPTAVTEQIRLLVPQLSSGGYKLERELRDLFQVACERELDLLCYRAGDERDLRAGRISVDDAKTVTAYALQAHNMYDILTISRSALLKLASVEVPQSPKDADADTLANLGVSPVPWQNDVLDLSAGALCGFAPWHVMVEQIRAFIFAVSWLRETSLVRVSSPDRKKAMAQLVHDGMGVALKHWSDTLGFSPAAAAYSLCVFEGERWDWREDRTRFFTLDSRLPSSPYRYLVNMRWRYCQIAGEFEKVVFINCDFRGSRFQKSRFSGVAFVNCLLDGAAFEDCEVVGQAPGHNSETPPDQRSGADRDALPQFLITDVSSSLVNEWDSYRGANSPVGAHLYSPTSGVAAVPWAKHVQTVDFRPHEAGLSMYGGRLSSLMISRCDFANGSMTLANIAGSSLDVVETDVLNLTLSWSAIRGVSITRLPGANAAPARDQGIRVSADSCVLYCTWFGTDLRGAVSITDCQVFSITNLSDDLDVTLADSTVGQGLGVRSELPPKSAAEMKSGVAAMSARTTYRSVPGRVELERRVTGGNGVPVAVG